MRDRSKQFDLSALVWSLTSQVRLYGAMVFVALSLLNSAMYLKSSHNAACAMLQNEIDSIVGPLGRELLVRDQQTANAIFSDFKHGLHQLQATESLTLQSGQGTESSLGCESHLFNASVNFPVKFGEKILGQIVGTVSYFSAMRLLAMIAIIFAVSSLGIRILSAKFTRKLQDELVGPIKQISLGEKLSESKNIPVEVIEIAEDIRVMEGEIKEKERQNFELLRARELGEQAEQLSHDIISPLNALNSVVLELKNIEENQKKTLRLAVKRIQEITRNLLKRDCYQENQKTHVVLDRVLTELISEKRAEYRSNSKIHFSIETDPTCKGCIVTANPAELKRVLSNLINNSVEALPGSGVVTIRAHAKDQNVFVMVEDNGKGIPSYLIEELTQRGKSYDKPTGSGLGLYYAKKTIQSWKGTLDIESVVGFGTKVHFSVPKAFHLEKTQTVEAPTDCILIDNDELTRLVWESSAEKEGVALKSYASSSEFFQVIDTLKRELPIYIDSDLGEHKRGEHIAKDIAELGFKNISLTTGFHSTHFPELPWITKIISKTPPWRNEEVKNAAS